MSLQSLGTGSLKARSATGQVQLTGQAVANPWGFGQGPVAPSSYNPANVAGRPTNPNAVAPDIPVPQGASLIDQAQLIYAKNPVLWGTLLLVMVISMGLKLKY